MAETNDFKIWALNVLPIVFDDYLSQKDLFVKLVRYVNGLLGDAVTLYNDYTAMDTGTIGDLEDLHTTEKGSVVGAINEVEDDVEALKTDKLDAPAVAGTSGQVLTSDGEGGQVWAAVGSGEIVVDNTLTVSGAAADAKVTGDEITSVKADITNLNLTYFYDNEVLSSTTNTSTKTVDIPVNHKGSLSFTVKNTSSGAGYAQVYFYDQANTQVYGYSEVISAGGSVSVSNIPLREDAVKLTISNPSNKDDLIFSVFISYGQDVIDGLYDLEELHDNTFINYGTPKIGYLGSDGAIHLQTQGDNRYIEIASVSEGETFVYSGGYTGWGLVFGYTADGTATTLLSAGTYENKTITITNANFVKLRAWSDISVKDLAFYSLKSLEAKVTKQNYDEIIVDASGWGDFTDIGSAIAYAKQNYDVDNYPVQIYIRDGIYNIYPTADYPFYALDKGANKINIKGQSREHTIIRCTCTSTLQGIALNIGGECVIENLTIQNLADASYTEETILEGNHRPYCIHNDSAPIDESKKYSTVVRNCTFYSECFCPIGGGLRKNQLQIYDNVLAIWTVDAVNVSGSSQYTGAVCVHAPSSSADQATGVRFIDCIMVAECERPALQLPNVSGSQSMADVEQTFVRNVTATRGSIEVSLSAPNNKTFWSKGNSNNSLNA